ncbi:MAG: PAS domain-containing protein [Alphaproteobacteria bacterium]
MAAMTAPLSMTQQRDRYLTFAFAASDLLVEVDGGGIIRFAAGGVRAILGIGEADAVGQPVVAFAQSDDQVLFSEFLYRLDRQQRAGDQTLTLIARGGKPVPVLVSGMRSPITENTYCLAVKRMPLVHRHTPEQVLESPLMPEDFAESVVRFGQQAAAADERMNLALFDVDWNAVLKKVDPDTAAKLAGDLVQCLRAWAGGGSAVGEIDDGKYSVLLDHTADAGVLARRLAEVASATAGGGIGVDHLALDLSEVEDFDGFEDVVEHALDRFKRVGAEEFHWTSFAQAARHLAEDRRIKAQPRRNDRRRGATEDWG